MKTKAPNARTVRMMQEPDANAPDVYTVRIREAGKESLYDVCQGTVDGRYRVWLWVKVLPSLTATCKQKPYTVDLGEFGDSCTCAGNRRWGHCRHVSATKALVASGKLPNLHEETT